MPISGPIGVNEQACLNGLRSSDRRALKALFASLKPPIMQEFSGEFDAELLDQGGRFADLMTASVFGIHGIWIGKAFHPTGEETGVGYNCFLQGYRIAPKLFMETRIADSTLADGQSLFLDYRTQNRGPIRWLVGELRMVMPTVILGIGTFGPKVGVRDRWRRKIPFVMVGPRRQYQMNAAA